MHLPFNPPNVCSLSDLSLEQISAFKQLYLIPGTNILIAGALIEHAPFGERFVQYEGRRIRVNLIPGEGNRKVPVVWD